MKKLRRESFSLTPTIDENGRTLFGLSQL